ncbi:MAG: Nicotinate-nucleotide--dimethylbenzimidazole phosphoribosyltransferase (EC [uncultured Thiotrichaceae bacterium]|uniref:Nicotinate-nucleotide--dimethylbenzimidazole phosphoribosyltransferase n=1 Tax=uncultured Thiotrichaceae bacterium TaxID=298394 RepID=A0A6S6S830_9GAMM|nr:MAG: Nicotinate-nucleotide--dimethylbenzimidazole phosphoribosyltransferase (EC [uncultured Thiotrichaceae bacterium]
MDWILSPCPKLDSRFETFAKARQAQLTKPLGALGKLESIAIRLSHLQQSEQPSLDTIAITVFAADHGLVDEGVSAFPQAVTAQMVHNFLQGGAAINVLANELNASLEVVDVGVKSDIAKHPTLISQKAGRGTANSTLEAAMQTAQLTMALQTGRDCIDRAIHHKVELFIAGEMGIGNTTAATALYCALLDLTPTQATGAGTGLDADAIHHKATVIQSILNKHQHCGNDALEWLRCVGGFEIAAMTGAYIAAAQQGLPILVDGFISTVAALYAVRIHSEVNDWLFFSHISAEQGHRKVLELLQQEALLDLDMRLGEGTGAAMAVPMMRNACALHNQMATFAEAAVATKL